MKENLTEQGLLAVASAVQGGERPESDLAKCGNFLGKKWGGDVAKQKCSTSCRHSTIWMARKALKAILPEFELTARHGPRIVGTPACQRTGCAGC